MEIVRIEGANLGAHLQDLIALNDEFLECLGSRRERRDETKREILANMVANTSTVLLLIIADDRTPAGVSYYNYGTGYSCGGVYLWLNCIYIRERYQKRGYGRQVVEFIEEEGRERGMKLLICSRHLDNEASERLFRGAAFAQAERMMMSKVYR